MENIQKLGTSEVEALAKEKNMDALYEMAWRMPPEVQCNPVESCAWQDYWFEKAADAGNIEAKCQYARSLINRIVDAEYRQKAMNYFQSLVDDFDAGKLTKDQEIDGIVSKMWLGIMLCEGYYTRRDASKGAELIESAYSLTNGFEGFGYRPLSTMGEIYATGLAQKGEVPSTGDLAKAIEYLDAAVRRFVPENDDPNNRGYLQLTKDQLNLQKERIEEKNNQRSSLVREDTYRSDADERRARMMQISDASKQRLDADKAALARLRQRLAREGW